MATTTSIEWTEVTWNPVTGCDRVAAGCDNCYALTLAKRLKAMGAEKYQKDGERTGRHIFTNVRVVFDAADADRATIHFTNTNFAGEGPAPVQGLGSPSAIADGVMECRRELDGHWLFTLFAPKQALIGEDDFMKLMLALNAKK